MRRHSSQRICAPARLRFGEVTTKRASRPPAAASRPLAARTARPPGSGSGRTGPCGRAAAWLARLLAGALRRALRAKPNGSPTLSSSRRVTRSSRGKPPSPLLPVLRRCGPRREASGEGKGCFAIAVIGWNPPFSVSADGRTRSSKEPRRSRWKIRPRRHHATAWLAGGRKLRRTARAREPRYVGGVAALRLARQLSGGTRHAEYKLPGVRRVADSLRRTLEQAGDAGEVSRRSSAGDAHSL